MRTRESKPEREDVSKGADLLCRPAAFGLRSLVPGCCREDPISAALRQVAR